MSIVSRSVAIATMALLVALGLWLGAPTHHQGPRVGPIGGVPEVGPSETASTSTSTEHRASATTHDLTGAPKDTHNMETVWPSGQVRSRGEWRGGLRYGEHQTWYENGQLQSIEIWDGEHQRNGRSIVFGSGGNLLADGIYELGYKRGEWRTYYENGQLESVGSWEPVDPQDRCRGQRRTGYWQFFLPNGALDEGRSGRYLLGQRVP